MSKFYTQKCFQVPDASKTPAQQNHQSAAHRAADLFDEVTSYIPLVPLASNPRMKAAKGIINAGTAVAKDAQAEYAAVTKDKTLVQRAVIKSTFKVYYPLKKLHDGAVELNKGIQYVQEKASSALRSADEWIRDTYTKKQQ